jgi:hypothetical protein
VDEMDGTYSFHGGEKFTQHFGQKLEKKRSLGRLRCRCDNNIVMDLNLAQGRNKSAW